TDLAERIIEQRSRHAFADIADVARRCALTTAQMEALATSGAFDSFGLSRRRALWLAGNPDTAGQLAGTGIAADPPALPGMNAVEEMSADLWATRMTVDAHPMEHLREALNEGGVLSVADAFCHEADRRVHVAGLVTHRQRPSTAGGINFINLEDETGMLNVVCSEGLWKRYRRVGRNAPALIIRGRLERNDGVTTLVADALTPVESAIPQAAAVTGSAHSSRDFCGAAGPECMCGDFDPGIKLD